MAHECPNLQRLQCAVDSRRLIDTAVGMIAVHSPTGSAGAVSDWLAERLQGEGFTVSRPDGGHAAAPAVVVRYDSGRPGPTLQFNGHLDTVHLPFVPPAVDGGRVTGSGAADMKGGLAAAIEALRALRETESLVAGSILLVAHDLHEAPWGLGEQLNRLIAEGCHGDAVLLPEPLCEHLPVVGRGAATWKATIRREGPPVHEVMRPRDEPNVVALGARLVERFMDLDRQLATRCDSAAGPESVFVGQIHAGEIYNQYPQSCLLEGTRRWLPDSNASQVEQEFRAVVSDVVARGGARADLDWRLVRGAFRLDQNHPIVAAFQSACQETTGSRLPTGPKPFVDDGNSFWSLANVPAITHGPRAGGQHTTSEWALVDDLVRVARLYALTAARYCGGL